MRTGIRCPNPMPPPIHVLSEGLSGGALQQAREARPIAPLGEAVKLDEHGGMGIVPPVQNRSLCGLGLLGIGAKEVEEYLDIRHLPSEGGGDQEQEQENGSGYQRWTLTPTPAKHRELWNVLVLYLGEHTMALPDPVATGGQSTLGEQSNSPRTPLLRDSFWEVILQPSRRRGSAPCMWPFS